MTKLKVIVVDDEQEAREGVRQLLAKEDGVELLMLCKNGLEAINKIDELKPDLVFLDIQMPEINGFEVLNSVEMRPLPMVIFITAFDRYALKAFEIHAIDYLLKPFSNERFYQALDFAKQSISNSSLDLIHEKLNSVLINYIDEDPHQSNNGLIHENSGLERLIVKSLGKIYFVQPDTIIWIEAYDYYIKIHVSDRYYLVRESMKKILERLPRSNFIRIHKSTAINLTYVDQLEPYLNGEFLIKMKDGTSLKMSRSYRKTLDKFIKK